VGRQAEPVGIHMALNPIHHSNTEIYLRHLRSAVEEARESRAIGSKAGQTY
jgi:hypothetical protein